MQFKKYQGAGNDFIIINNIREQIPQEELSRIAAKLCPRRISVGADGFMAAEKPQHGGDFRMLFYNADGSEGEMCGNGARCIARFGFEEGLAGEEMAIETVAGMVRAFRLDEDLYKIRLNDVTTMNLECKLQVEIDGESAVWNCAYVELGNPGIPHLVVKYAGLAETDEKKLWKLGNALRRHNSLPKGANVNFYEINKDGSIFERTFERGVEDFTYACGTGTGSVAAVLIREGIVSGDMPVSISMTGGVLQIEAIRDNEGNFTDIYLIGPAEKVYTGEISL